MMKKAMVVIRYALDSATRIARTRSGVGGLLMSNPLSSVPANSVSPPPESNVGQTLPKRSCHRSVTWPMGQVLPTESSASVPRYPLVLHRGIPLATFGTNLPFFFRFMNLMDPEGCASPPDRPWLEARRGSICRRTAWRPLSGFASFSRGCVLASPKRAIDGDLIQDALEDSQLFSIESRDKEIGDPAQVDRRRLGQPGHARISQYDHDTASVCIGVDSTNEAFVNQPRDTASHARPRHERPGREVGHAQLATRERQLSEHVEIGQGQAGLLFEIRVELAHERGVCSQQ